eukprot:gnl/TRDRNA2_/TRDRNA2_194929_c0_seq1.p1 gnl/TRDRNA2_/TRDRNA2_194929_c0~~gnl/TRDRNA2_/TRDRNA2_194929_c0_seq1.p1  ORF type:complete len:301 (+),score=68.51 gnl/TRDRNA2_/TRDRNA2_194929_c0_seq1:98-1000(+)
MQLEIQEQNNMNAETLYAAKTSEANGELKFSLHFISGAKAMTVSMKPTDSIRLLKVKVEEKEGTPREELRLLGGASILSNRLTMAEVNTLYGDSLQLVKQPPAIYTREIDTSFDGGIAVLKPERNYEPTEDEVDNYCEWLGINPDVDRKYLWIAEEGLKCEVPHPWKACSTESGDIFYFNFQTSESSWLHPSDEYYRKLYKSLKIEEKVVLPTSMPPVNPSRRQGLSNRLRLGDEDTPTKRKWSSKFMRKDREQRAALQECASFTRLEATPTEEATGSSAERLVDRNTFVDRSASAQAMP